MHIKSLDSLKETVVKIIEKIKLDKLKNDKTCINYSKI